LALPCAPYKHYLCFNTFGSLAMLAAMRRASSRLLGTSFALAERSLWVHLSGPMLAS
jgi:hypothetical protein